MIDGPKKRGRKLGSVQVNAGGIQVCAQGHEVAGYNAVKLKRGVRCRICKNRLARAKYRVGKRRFAKMRPEEYIEPKVEPRPLITCHLCRYESRIKNDFLLHSDPFWRGFETCQVCMNHYGPVAASMPRTKRQ